MAATASRAVCGADTHPTADQQTIFVCTSSVSDLRKFRKGSNRPSLATAVDEGDARPRGNSSLPRKAIQYTRAEEDRDELRLLNWRRLGPTLRIQRWIRRVWARQNVQLLLERRRQAHELEWQHTAAELIQKAWRGYVCYSKYKQTLRDRQMSDG
eukprot:Sspe_Gene.50874::Locus_28267_Transcript_1_1_Confidence_1.000_Length_617::g.50874::m.50874